jgi:integrase
VILLRSAYATSSSGGVASASSKPSRRCKESCDSALPRLTSAAWLLRNSNVRQRVLTPAAVAVGLGGLSPHDLRQTAASLAIAAGANA